MILQSVELSQRGQDGHHAPSLVVTVLEHAVAASSRQTTQLINVKLNSITVLIHTKEKKLMTE